MRLTNQQLLGLPVETQIGFKLGFIKSIEIDSAEHVIVCYIIQSASLPRPFAKTLLVSPTQVIEITQDKMIVDEALRGGIAEASPAVGI